MEDKIMLFQFIINLTDEDYLDYNVFWNLKSAYGKKTAILIRVICSRMHNKNTVFLAFLDNLGRRTGTFDTYHQSHTAIT